MPDARQHYSRIASYLLAAIGLLLVLKLHLLAALFAGLLVYEVVDTLTPQLQKLIAGERARWLAVALLAVLVIGLLVLAIFGVVAFFRSEVGSTGEFYQRLMPILEQAREQLPAWIVNHLPDSTDEVRSVVAELLQRHADRLQLAGKETARVLAQLLLGMVLGALIALNAARGTPNPAPLADALSARCENLSQSFHEVVFAQVKISLLNTLFTAIFLLIALPAFGVMLPLAKTLVLITFIAGLLPVVGNLISNTLVTVVALSVSFWVAMAALIFLVAIHKLEYFLNARIVGTQIRARAWEILLAMLLMEAAFGLAGVVAAPVYYAFLKHELTAARLV